MKKTLALLLTITMLATLCVGCAPKKPEKPQTTTPIVDTPPVETPTEDIEPTEPENVEKFEDISTKYIVSAVPNYRDGKIDNVEEQIDDALADNDIDTMNKLITNMGQTIVLIPDNGKYEYSEEYYGCTISFNDDEVEIYIMEYEDEEFDDEIIKEEELNYINHSGAIYKYPNDDPMRAYIGFTPNKTVIGALGSNVDMIKTILGEIIVIESDFSEPADVETVLSTLDKNGVATTVPDYQSIISYANSEKYEVETDEDGIYVLLNEEVFQKVYIEMDDTYTVGLEITDHMIDYQDFEDVKYMETENLFGFGFYENEDSIFYGFDKDTFAALVIDSCSCTLEELYKVIQEVDVTKMAFNTKLINAVDDSIMQRDQSAADELGLAIQLALVNDQDVYDAVGPYVYNNNVSCYVDLTPVPSDSAKVLYNCSHVKDVEHYLEHYYYTDEARQSVGMYRPNGFMNGFTITFYPVKYRDTYQYKIADGIINEYVKPGGLMYVTEDISYFKYQNGSIPDYDKHGTLSTMESTYLYNRIRATIGDFIEIVSVHHQSVPLTIFVAIDGTNVYVDSQFGGFVN